MILNVVLILLSARGIWAFTVPNAHPSNNVGIIGGHKVRIEDAPYMASLRLNETFHYCGASIIHERFILTAAHCILPNQPYKVLVGASRLHEGGILYDAEKIIKHELFNATTGDYDVCVIKLNDSLGFSNQVNKLLLADSTFKVPSGTLFKATGWGKTEQGDVSEDLLQIDVPLVSTFNCRLLYLKYRMPITNRMLCAGTPGRDTCQGDSGGPLNIANIQIGITSFGIGCNSMPGVYTKISAVLPWILDNVEKNLDG